MTASHTNLEALTSAEQAELVRLHAKAGQHLSRYLTEYLTYEDVCQRLKISRAHAIRLVDAGILRPIRLGGAVRFRASDLANLDAAKPVRKRR